MHTILEKIGSLLIAPLIFIGGLFSPSVPAQAPLQTVGATLPSATGVFETSLATPITATATSLTLTSNSIRGGGSLSGYTCFTLDEGTSQAEVLCGTVASTAVTSLTRGISYADGITSITANKFAHRRGASVKITDFPIIQILKAQNNGEATFENPISYKTGVGPISNGDLTDKEYVLSVVSGGTVTTNQVIISGTVGENVIAGNIVYLKSDGKWWKTSGNTLATIDQVQLGIAQGTGTTDGLIASGILIKGVDTNNTGTAGNYAYVSDTSGTVGTSAGTYSKIIGQFIPSSGGLYFDPTYYGQPTVGQNAGLSGTRGVPSSNNKYVTQDNVYTADYDQSQTTQNGTVEVGEASTLTKKNKLAGSFVPTKTKIRGVSLYKLSDTGTFTGTVTIDLLADSGGSPTGSSLATVTITNAQWLTLPAGEFTATFSTEYASLIQGSLYWYQITTSTSDTTNHINLGTNTAGGYASGSVKYYNAQDNPNWTAIATIDLYFKTLQGVLNQITGIGSSITQRFIYTNTWTKPTNAKSVKVVVIGGGGSGASGDARSYSTGSDCVGGGAGGGGSITFGEFDATLLPSTVTVTVGAQVAGGVGVSSSGTGLVNGNNGTDGNSSSFGSYLVANGGKKGNAIASNGGNGGYVTGFNTSIGTVTSATAILGQGGNGGSNADGTSAEYGGGGGADGMSTATTPYKGGSSIFSSGGGGAGGYVISNNASRTDGGDGGATLTYTVGGGGAGSVAGQNTPSLAGTAGTRTGYGASGGGGSGGTYYSSGGGTGGAGGAGGIPGGGGGGSGGIGGATGTTLTSGAGGVGARGEVIVITYF